MGTGGDAFLCSVTGKLGHVIKVGGRHSITWDQINTDDEDSGVRGLHCGNLSYVKGFQSSGTETHNTLVCPSKVGAVPDDTLGALRCVEYFTLDCFSGVNGSIYHSSKYGEKLDSEWSIEKAQIIKDYGLLLKKDTDQINNEINRIEGL
jgi:hypothetical protein